MVSESKENNVVFPYELQAKNGDEMPDGLEYPDQIAYLSFRSLYDQYGRGLVNRDSAIREKKKILEEYEQNKFVAQMGKQWVKVIKDTELARAEYRKDPTVDNGMKLIAIIEGRKTVGI